MRLIDRIKNKLARPLAYRGIVGPFSQPPTAEVFTNARLHAYTGLYKNSDNKLVAASAFHEHKLDKLIARSRALNVIKSRCAVTIGHGPWNNYYHWYIDSLPRLLALREITEPVELFVSQLLPPEVELLLQALAGEHVQVRYVNNLTSVDAAKAYYLPFLSESCNAELPAQYLDFFRPIAFRLFNQAPPAERFKLFISRAGSGRRVFSNQTEVEEFMRQHGYTIVQLESLTLAQQVFYFQHAEKIVASHGAGLTNLLYAGKCSVFEIFHSDEVLEHYSGLCRALNLAYDHCTLNGKHKDETVFLPLATITNWINRKP